MLFFFHPTERLQVIQNASNCWILICREIQNIASYSVYPTTYSPSKSIQLLDAIKKLLDEYYKIFGTFEFRGTTYPKILDVGDVLLDELFGSLALYKQWPIFFACLYIKEEPVTKIVFINIHP